MDSSAEWQHAVRSVPASPAGLTSDRIELRVQAIELATRGWAIRPGTLPQHGERRGNPGSPAGSSRAGLPEPVHADWAGFPELSATELAEWWAERPYSLLLATGRGANAFEVDADLGRRAAGYLRAAGSPAPIAANPLGRWYFLTRDEELVGHLLDELAEERDERIGIHGGGSWIPLPPSAFPHGVVHWRVQPELCGWQLPSAEYVRNALCAAMNPSTTEQATDVVDLLMAGR
ncbi:bifunctional DNA primase/polymerase [Salinifilum aidingensis]